jgi:4-alpha-glucanotransferase
MQDLLSLGNEGRMNFPGKAAGNWGWRFTNEKVNWTLTSRLKEMNFFYSRTNRPD